MASIGEDEHGFYVRWRDPDGGSRRRRFSTKRQPRRAAERAARAHLAQVQQAEIDGARWERPRPLRVPGLTDALDEYIRDYARSRAAGTVQREALNLRAFRAFVLGQHRDPGIDVLSRQLLADFYAERRESPRVAGRHLLDDKRRTAGTVAKYVHSVEAFWAWLFDHDEYGDHVARPRRLDMPSDEGSPTRAPTWEEMDAVVLAARGWQQRVAYVLRFTGLRVGQVMGLRWEHFDLDARLLYFPGHLGKSRVERHGRVIPLSPHLVAELATWGKREGWLIDSGRRPGPRERVFRARDMARAWQRAGVREEVWRKRPDHAYRKGITSGLAQLRADPEAVEYLVGRKLLGERQQYVDALVALPLRETVGLIPPIGGSGVVRLGVHGVSKRGAS